MLGPSPVLSTAIDEEMLADMVTVKVVGGQAAKGNKQCTGVRGGARRKEAGRAGLRSGLRSSTAFIGLRGRHNRRLVPI